MKKYLFFRTDRVGDFLLTSIILKGIKRKEPFSEITVIASEKNYDFIETMSYVDKVLLFPKSLKEKKNFLKHINKENQFDYLVVTDRKDKSIIFSLFIKAKIKILNITKKFYYFLKLLPKINILLDNEKKDLKIEVIKKNLDLLRINFEKNDLNIFENELNNPKLIGNKKLFNDDYAIIHFDEKWFKKEYINEYTDIKPTKNEFNFFIKELINKLNKNIIITCGSKNLSIHDELKDEFTKIDNNIYLKEILGKKIFFINNQDYINSCSLIKKSYYWIGCHGSFTHVASSFNVKILDIIELSRRNFYNTYTNHLNNYNFLPREKFLILSKKIINFF